MLPPVARALPRDRRGSATQDSSSPPLRFAADGPGIIPHPRRTLSPDADQAPLGFTRRRAQPREVEAGRHQGATIAATIPGHALRSRVAPLAAGQRPHLAAQAVAD